MSRRNLRFPVYALEVTNLSNRLKLLQLDIIRRIGICRDRCRWPHWSVGYEKWLRNLLQDKEKFGILFACLPRFTGD
jgi:hypothetical protein